MLIKNNHQIKARKVPLDTSKLTSTIDKVGRYDVLCSEGLFNAKLHGNKKFSEILAAKNHSSRISEATITKVKAAVDMFILHSPAPGGRFLISLVGSQRHVAISRKAAVRWAYQEVRGSKNRGNILHAMKTKKVKANKNVVPFWGMLQNFESKEEWSPLMQVHSCRKRLCAVQGNDDYDFFSIAYIKMRFLTAREKHYKMSFIPLLSDFGQRTHLTSVFAQFGIQQLSFPAHNQHQTIVKI